MIAVSSDAERVIIVWPDQHRSEYHSLWLLDNRPENRDQRNGQRLIDVTDLPEVAPIAHAVENEETLELTWADGSAGAIPLAWLREHCPCAAHVETRFVRLWNGHTPELQRRFRYSEVTADPAVRLAWLRAVLELGIAFLSGVPTEEQRVLDVAALVGWVRDTNYGRVFDVRAAAKPGNLADTEIALGLHTDNPYREPVPGLQVLHCLRSSRSGGDSVFVDGFSVVEQLRKDCPRAATVLERTRVRFEYTSDTCHLSAERRIIEADAGLRPTAIHYNNRSIAPLRLPAKEAAEFYGASREFAKLLSDPDLLVTTRLVEGDVVVFNNRRILHGRTAFDSTSERHLQGCYLDHDGLFSNLTVAERLLRNTVARE